MQHAPPLALPPLRPAAEAAPCKVCGQPARVVGRIDFNKACEEVRGKVLPSSGVYLPYRQCAACGLVFTDALDDWSPDDFKDHIYNEGYAAVDPDYVEARPNAMAGMVARMFRDAASELDMLDYGGGNGRLAENLLRAGFRSATTYDPFNPAFAERPTRTYELITCFETLEHVPDPLATARELAGLLADPGIIFFSTLVQPQDIGRIGLKWWYIGPRNGHITIHSRNSLAASWRAVGLDMVSFNEGYHAAFRTPPASAARLMTQAKPI